MGLLLLLLLLLLMLLLLLLLFGVPRAHRRCRLVKPGVFFVHDVNVVVSNQSNITASSSVVLESRKSEYCDEGEDIMKIELDVDR